MAHVDVDRGPEATGLSGDHPAVCSSPSPIPMTRRQGITNGSKAKSQNAKNRGPTAGFPAKSNTCIVTTSAYLRPICILRGDDIGFLAQTKWERVGNMTSGPALRPPSPGIDTSKSRNAIAIADAAVAARYDISASFLPRRRPSEKLVAKLAAKCSHLTFCYEKGRQNMARSNSSR
ncbi:hypothetical protein ACVWXO_000981 [Bradyrhizobium sp. LM2.7]